MLKEINSNYPSIRLFINHNNNKVIMLSPRLEEWIIKEANMMGIRMSDFGLSDSASYLHKVLNRKNNLAKFKDLINSIKDGKGMKALKSLIC